MKKRYDKAIKYYSSREACSLRCLSQHRHRGMSADHSYRRHAAYKAALRSIPTSSSRSRAGIMAQAPRPEIAAFSFMVTCKMYAPGRRRCSLEYLPKRGEHGTRRSTRSTPRPGSSIACAKPTAPRILMARRQSINVDRKPRLAQRSSTQLLLGGDFYLRLERFRRNAEFPGHMRL